MDTLDLIAVIVIMVMLYLIVKELRKPRTIQVERDENGRIVSIVET